MEIFPSDAAMIVVGAVNLYTMSNEEATLASTWTTHVETNGIFPSIICIGVVGINI